MSAAATPNELALLAKLQTRSEERDAAWAELFATYRSRVFTVCRHLLRSRADAEDATQEVFMALSRALPSFRAEASLNTFIHRVAVRLAVKHRAKQRRHQELRVEAPDDAAAAASDPRDPLEVKEQQARLWQAMEALSLEQRTVLALFAVEGLGHGEIAAILGIPEGTVWSRLHHARKRLAQLLA